MPRARLSFRQRDIARAIKAVRSTGANVTGVTVDRDGRIAVQIGDGSVATSSEPSAQLDDWLRRKGDTDARSA